MTHITDTIAFEIRKNLKKTIIIAVLTAIIIYLDMVVIESLKEDLGMENPENIIDYLSGRFSLFGMLLMISACAFFGSIIVEDNEKRTGNIMFPKIGKDRLIIGRYIALFILFTVIILLYYAAISISALITY
jgi:ABC-type transport system involved in multi-copper enzyme maturation permease subunit